MRLCVQKLIGFLWVSTMAAVPFAQNESEAETRTKLLALQHAWNQAEQFDDLKALDSLLDNDLIYVDSDGTLMTKADFLILVESRHVQAAVSDSMTVQVFDDTAVVNGTYRTKELRNGKVATRTGRFTNTWMYKRSHWVCIAAQATPISHETGP